MNICIDIGNSRSKIGFFKGSTLIETVILEKNKFEDFSRYFPGDINRDGQSKVLCIIASVRAKFPELNPLMELCDVIYLGHATPLPFQNNYSSPETLGNDRLAAVAGAHFLFPGKDVLIIDAGTALTFDFISAGGKYIGGSISPGINMRYKALQYYTDKLPLIDTIRPKVELIGGDTVGSIESGVLNGIHKEVEGMIASYRERYPDMEVVCTGGDLKYFADRLKNNIFAVENLVLLGLNHILKYNAEK